MSMKKLMTVAAICVAAAMPSWADKTISENTTLTEDTDWRDQGVVTIAEGVTLNLNGYTLRVSALAGTGGIVESQQYEFLEYIEANGQQGIVTDLKPGADTKVDVVFTPMDANTGTLFGTQWGNSGFLAFGSGGTWYGLFNTKNGTFSAGTRYRFIVDSGTATLQNDETGQNVSSKSGVNMSGGNLPLGICCCGIGNQPGRFKIHSMKVWHANVMRFDFVPAREAATGAVGLFNRVDDTFHVSGSTTPFIAGLTVGNLRIEAASEAALADFTGTVADTVCMAIDGDCTLTEDTDWRRFPTLRIDGTVDLAGHDLSLSDLRGTGGITDLGDIPLKYVESTAQQVVDTGIDATTDTAVELDFTFLAGNDSNGRIILGSGAWGGTAYMFAYCPERCRQTVRPGDRCATLQRDKNVQQHSHRQKAGPFRLGRQGCGANEQNQSPFVQDIEGRGFEAQSRADAQEQKGGAVRPRDRGFPRQRNGRGPRGWTGSG